MSRKTLSPFALLSLAFGLAVFSGAQTASAQSLFGGSGGSTSRGGQQSQGAGTQFGSSSGTIRSTSPTSGFSSSFGSTSQAGALNRGGLGGNALNTAGGAGQTSALGGPQITTELGALSATIGQGGFIGQADNMGRFVGQQSAGQQSLQGTRTGGSQFGNRGQGGANQQNNFNQQSQNRRTIRPQQRIAFEYPQRAADAIETELNTQFQRLQTTRPELEGVEIVLAGNNQVILRGQVQSEDDKKLAAMYARMEPGVRSVKNELTVEGN